MRRLLTAVALSNMIGAFLNLFGSIFDVAGLVIAGGVFIISALIGAIICLIKTFC